MYVLGISAFYHDSAACIVQDGAILAAAQEERFTRKKHDQSFPVNAVNYCLKEAGIGGADVSIVVFYEKPFLKFERLLETYLAFAPRGLKSFVMAIPVWVRDKLFQKSLLLRKLAACLDEKIDWRERLLFSEHHLSHAASAFYPSPFSSAAILTIDGVGEWTTTCISVGNDQHLEKIREIRFPHSLGLLYSAFTFYAGFKVNSGEYKLMGLAPYGEPKYADVILEKLIDVADDGSFKLNMDYFDYPAGLKMTSRKFEKLFGGSPRQPEAPITQKEMDLAASIQKVTEDIVLRIAASVATDTGEKNLCMAGGVALNSASNGALARSDIFENVWVQPASGDAGAALGAALAVWHLYFDKNRRLVDKKDSMKGSYLGPSFSNNEIQEALEASGAIFKKMDQQELIEKTSEALSGGAAVGWMQGRMEFGPRALGNRSILADPRSQAMQSLLNQKVKRRESFRPFAPSILLERVSEWFDSAQESQYMMFISFLQKSRRHSLTSAELQLKGLHKLDVQRSSVSAVTHVDYSARLQTVSKETNPLFHALLKKFEQKTGCPMIVNTSFNVRGEPIVCSVMDAFGCFMRTELDILAIGDFYLTKEEQNKEIAGAYIEEFDLD